MQRMFSKAKHSSRVIAIALALTAFQPIFEKPARAEGSNVCITADTNFKKPLKEKFDGVYTVFRNATDSSRFDSVKIDVDIEVMEGDVRIKKIRSTVDFTEEEMKKLTKEMENILKTVKFQKRGCRTMTMTYERTPERSNDEEEETAFG